MDSFVCSCCSEEYNSNYNTQEKIRSNLEAYLAFLDEEIDVQEFLAYDICSVFADKYILAVIFKYFMRWNMGAVCFGKDVFFVALNIACDVFEDNDKEMKTDLYMWTLGSGFKSRLQEFTDIKIQFFFELGLKTLVCEKWCETLFEMVPGHSAWQRIREEGHAGAHRSVFQQVEDGSWAVRQNRGECSHCLRRDELLRELPDFNMHEE